MAIVYLQDACSGGVVVLEGGGLERMSDDASDNHIVLVFMRLLLVLLLKWTAMYLSMRMSNCGVQLLRGVCNVVLVFLFNSVLKQVASKVAGPGFFFSKSMTSCWPGLCDVSETGLTGLAQPATQPSSPSLTRLGRAGLSEARQRMFVAQGPTHQQLTPARG